MRLLFAAALAVAMDRRHPLLPGAPTFKQLGKK